MRHIELSIQFPPTPWKRPAGRVVRYDAQLYEKQAFALKVFKALELTGFELGPLFMRGVPLSVKMIFHFKKPSLSKLVMPTHLNDVDNLSKFVLDALQSGCLINKIWVDDGQVVRLVSEKRWCNSEEFIELEIKELVL